VLPRIAGSKRSKEAEIEAVAQSCIYEHQSRKRDEYGKHSLVNHIGASEEKTSRSYVTTESVLDDQDELVSSRSAQAFGASTQN
jgi:hypothetical protein